MAYMPKTVTTPDGRTITIAVQDDGSADVGANPFDPQASPAFTQNAPTQLEQLRGDMAQSQMPKGSVWDDLFSSQKHGVDTMGPTKPVDWQGMGSKLKELNAAVKPGVDREYTPEELAAKNGTAVPAPAETKRPATDFVGGAGTGGSGPNYQPAMAQGGSDGLGFGVKIPMGGSAGMGGPSGSFGRDEKAAKAAFQRQEDANKAAFDAGQQEAHARAGFAEQAANLAEQQRQQEMDFQKDRKTALDAQFKNYQQAQDEVAKVNTTIDPNRFWASKTTGQRVMAGLAIAAGYLGRGPQHNQALDFISKAISDDIDAQKSMVDFQLKKGNEKVAGAQTLYGMMRQRFGDDSTALTATNAAALGVIQKKLEATIAGTADAQQKAALQQVQAKLGMEQQGYMQDLHLKMDDHAIRWGELRRQERNDLLDFQAKKAAGGNNKKAIEDIQQVEEKYRNIEANTARLKKLINENGTQENWTPGVRKEMDQLRAGLAVDMAKVKDPNSVVRESEMAGEMANIFDPGYAQRSSSAQAGLDSFLAQARLRRRNAYEARGFKAPEDQDSKDKSVGFTSR